VKGEVGDEGLPGLKGEIGSPGVPGTPVSISHVLLNDTTTTTTTTTTTRMVQLPATAAIEYVAACWVSGAGGIFVLWCLCPGGLLPGGTFVRGLMPVPPKFNAYTHRLELSVPSNVA